MLYSAADHALSSGKKTVMPKDVFDAMTALEFEFFLPRLEAEVTKFTSIQADKRNTYRKKVREEKKAATSTPIKSTNSDVQEAVDGEPAAKRVRRSSGAGEEHQSGSEDEGEGDETADVEDEEVEEDEIEEEVVEEGLTEDPLEEREDKEEDEDMEDGDESD